MTEAKLSYAHLKNPVTLLALGFGAGYTPRMPGTAGTVVGVICFLPMQSLPWFYYLALVSMLFLLGVRVCDRAAAMLGVHDHPAIVWDEIVGYLITMTAAPRGWVWILLGFVLFRLFDIWKPWPVRWLDKRVKGGLGIMIDDVLAALYGLILLQFIAYLSLT